MAPYPYHDETVFSRFRAMATSRPAQPFLRVLPDVAEAYGCAAGDISYGNMASQVAARRDVLAAAGLPVGARIGLYLFNTPDFFVNWLAANALGLSIVPINPDLKRRETDFIIAHSGDKHGTAEEHYKAFPDGRVGSHSAMANREIGKKIVNASVEGFLEEVERLNLTLL